MVEAGIPLVEVIRMMATTPARLLGVEYRKGALVVGKDADIVVFDEDIRVGMTMVAGKVIYAS
jgi:N-acetylglucosamine-6-phosphate deacetylase